MTDQAGFYASDEMGPPAPPEPLTPWEIITEYLSAEVLRGAHGADARVTAAEIINRLYRGRYSITRNPC